MGSFCMTAGMTAGTTKMRAAMPIEAKRKKPTIGAPKHQSHEPRVFCVLSAVALHESVERIITRIRRDEDVYCSSGTYLYISPDRTVYLVREELTCSQRWIREHFPWLVGFYTHLPNPNKGLSLEAQGMAEDITEHLNQTSSAADGRQCVGLQQTGEGNSLQPATDAAALQRSKPVGAGKGDISSSGGGAFNHHSEENGDG